MSRKSVSHNRLTKGQLPLTPRFEYAREISKIKGATLRHRGDEQQEQVGEPREHGLIPVRRAAQVAVMHARPYPRLALRRELHLEYPPDHHAVLEHVLVLQAIAEGARLMISGAIAAAAVAAASGVAAMVASMVWGPSSFEAPYAGNG